MSYEVHPAAAVFPMLPDDELQALAHDIAANGLIHPIVTTPDGTVLDGRNRLAACELTLVEPTFAVYDGDPVAYVLSANNHRRHITKGQRAMAGVLAIRNDYGSDAAAAQAVGVSEALVRWARTVAEHAPSLVEAVLRHDEPVALKTAYDDAVRVRDAAELDPARLERLTKEAPDLVELIQSDVLTLAGAEAELRERQRIHREAVERDAERLRKFISGWFTFSTLDGNPDRADVLDSLAPPDREQLDEISGRITWTRT